MSLVGRKSEARGHFKLARRYANPEKKDFDLKLAIEELKQAILLGPGEVRYQTELGKLYLKAPELAITRGIDIRFKLTESANLAVPGLEKAAALCQAYSKDQRDIQFNIILGYLYLGEWEKAVQAVPGLQKGWESRLPEENAGLVSRALRWMEEREEILCPAITAYMILDAAYYIAMEGKSNPQRFAVRAGRMVFLKGIRIRESQIQAPQRDEARKHLEQAIVYRNQSKYGDAKREFDKTFGLATGYAWWYQTLCEFGGRPLPKGYSITLR